MAVFTASRSKMESWMAELGSKDDPPPEIEEMTAANDDKVVIVAADGKRAKPVKAGDAITAQDKRAESEVPPGNQEPPSHDQATSDDDLTTPENGDNPMATLRPKDAYDDDEDSVPPHPHPRASVMPLESGDEGDIDMRSVTDKANESADREMEENDEVPITDAVEKKRRGFLCCGGGGGEKEPKKEGGKGRMRNMCWHAFKNLAPIVFIIVFSLVGGLFIWLMDKNLGLIFKMPDSWSTDVFGYLESVNYVCSLFTTIGYGTLAASKWHSRLFTVFYSIVGIPATAIVLDGIGKFFARSFWHLYDKLVLRRARKKLSPQEQAMLAAKSKGEMRMDEFPLWGAILITLVWVLLTAWHFWIWSSNWSYGTAVYFVFISMSTIGLGDLYPVAIVAMLLGFYFIMLGLSMFTMCWTLAQMKLENFAKGVSETMQEKIFENLDVEQMKKEGTQINIDKMLKEQGVSWIMRKAMGESLKRKLKEQLQQRANQRHASTQVDIRLSLVNAAQQCVPKKPRRQHNGTQTAPTISVVPPTVTQGTPEVKSSGQVTALAAGPSFRPVSPAMKKKLNQPPRKPNARVSEMLNAPTQDDDKTDK